mmetsp:Transcript_2136/g.1475  ORF Transcript_2136/g.1475 Transcript_2136/m.1475 type:complete len:200 (+) Transcript_2136:398-997(+)
MSHVSFLKTKTSRSNESLKFRGLTDEVWANKCYLIDHTLPDLLLSFTRFQYLKHFIFGHGFDFLNGYLPFASLLFSLLFDHITEYFGAIHFISVQQICGNGTFFLFLFTLSCCLFLLVGLNHFLHFNLLFVAFFSKQFTFDSVQLLCFLGHVFDFTGITFTAFLLRIEALTIALLKQFHVIVLRHDYGQSLYVFLVSLL